MSFDGAGLPDDPTIPDDFADDIGLNSPGNIEDNDEEQLKTSLVGGQVDDEKTDPELEALVQTYLYNTSFKTSRNEGVFNIVYSLINAAILALPFTASECGVVFYTVALVFFGVISTYSTVIVVEMASDKKVRNLEDLSEEAFGAKGLFIVLFFHVLHSVCLMCISLSVYADIMADVIRSTSSQLSGGLLYLASYEGQVLVGALFVLFICTATRSMISLRFTSYITVFAVISALVAVTGALISDFTVDSSIQLVDSDIAELQSKWWIFVFIIPFCFSFNQKALMVYSCLRERSTSRWTSVARRALTTVTLIYLLFGNIGYIAQYVHDVGGDNLLTINFFKQDIAGNQTFIDVIRSVVALSLLLTIPVDCLVASTTVKKLMRRVFKLHRKYSESKMMGSGNDQFYNAYDMGRRKSSDGASSSRLSLTNSFCSILSCCCMPTHKISNMSSTNGDQRRDISRAISKSSSGDGRRLMDEDWDYDPSNITNSSGSERQTMDTDFGSGAGSFRNSAGRESDGSSGKFSGRNSTGSYYKYGRTSDNDALNADSDRLGAIPEHSNSFADSEASKSSSGLGSFRDSEDLLRALDDKFGVFDVPEPGGKGEIARRSSAEGRAKSPVQRPSRDGADSIDRQRNSSRNNDVNTNAIHSNREGLESDHRLDHERDASFSQGDLSARPGANYFTDVKRLNRMTTFQFSWSFFFSLLPTLLLWLLVIVICYFWPKVAHLAAAFGSFTTAVLVYILPSMMYFRIGVISDYQVIPCLGFIPNRVYMFFVQIVGVILFLTNTFLLLWCLLTSQQILNN